MGSCPECRTARERPSIPNIALKAAISHVEAKCKFFEQGCTHVAELQHLLAHEGACEYRPEFCPACRKRYLAKDRKLSKSHAAGCALRIEYKRAREMEKKMACQAAEIKALKRQLSQLSRKKEEPPKKKLRPAKAKPLAVVNNTFLRDEQGWPRPRSANTNLFGSPPKTNIFAVARNP